MDMSQISALFQGIQVATQLLASAVDARDEAQVAKAQAEMHKALADAFGAVLAIQAKMFSQMEKLMAMHDELALANQKIVELNKTRSEAARYERFEFPSGRLVLRIKPEHQGTDPLHYLCQSCFDEGFHMVLQPEKWSTGTCYTCPKCNNQNWFDAISSASVRRGLINDAGF